MSRSTPSNNSRSGSWLGDLTNAALDLVLPPRCPACDALLASDELFCPACVVGVMPPFDPCPRCGEPEARAHCTRCRRHPPAFLRLHAAVLYGGPVAEAIGRFKYGRRGDLARPLGQLLIGATPLVELAAAVDLIAPVPLHARRLRERGFNQAALLARPLARALRRPLRCRLLERRRETHAQASLGFAARRSNVAGAFAVRDAERARVIERRVLLVDDVATTAATADACADALLAAGARAVQVCVLARAG